MYESCLCAVFLTYQDIFQYRIHVDSLQNIQIQIRASFKFDFPIFNLPKLLEFGIEFDRGPRESIRSIALTPSIRGSHLPSSLTVSMNLSLAPSLPYSLISLPPCLPSFHHSCLPNSLCGLNLHPSRSSHLPSS